MWTGSSELRPKAALFTKFRFHSWSRKFDLQSGSMVRQMMSRYQSWNFWSAADFIEEVGSWSSERFFCHVNYERSSELNNYGDLIYPKTEQKGSAVGDEAPPVEDGENQAWEFVMRLEDRVRWQLAHSGRLRPTGGVKHSDSDSVETGMLSAKKALRWIEGNILSNSRKF